MGRVTIYSTEDGKARTVSAVTAKESVSLGRSTYEDPNVQPAEEPEAEDKEPEPKRKKKAKKDSETSTDNTDEDKPKKRTRKKPKKENTDEE